MIDAYSLLKYVHILLAVVAVGFNASYGIWIGRASRDPRHLPHVLRGVKFLDDRVANPAYALLLLTGWGMVEVGGWGWTTFWINAALGLYVVTVLGGLLGYTPTLRKQIDALEAHGAASDEYRRLSTRSTVLGVGLMVLVLAIVFLMVTKPAPF